jgi:hypothetical protein
MTILQIILTVTHLSIAFVFYNWGKADGIVEGRIAVRRYYEQLTR